MKGRKYFFYIQLDIIELVFTNNNNNNNKGTPLTKTKNNIRHFHVFLQKGLTITVLGEYHKFLTCLYIINCPRQCTLKDDMPCQKGFDYFSTNSR